MSLGSLPFKHAVANTRGAAAATSIPVGGILATDTLLAVIQHNAGAGEVAGLDPAAFAVSAGAIESASLDTAGDYLTIIYAT